MQFEMQCIHYQSYIDCIFLFALVQQRNSFHLRKVSCIFALAATEVNGTIRCSSADSKSTNQSVACIKPSHE